MMNDFELFLLSLVVLRDIMLIVASGVLVTVMCRDMNRRHM